MKQIRVQLAANETRYVPAPARGVIAAIRAVWQGTVTTSNILTVSQGATTVNVATVVTTAGMVVETGVPDTTNGFAVFDPNVAAQSVIKLVLSGGNAIAADVLIDYDDSAYVKQTSDES